MSWMSRALCRTRPAEWWWTGDDGNRLALLICSACPVVDRCTGDEPHGVIVGGVAYDDHGERLGLCGCGRPVPYPVRAFCYTCVPSQRTVVPAVKRRGRPRKLDQHLVAVVELLGQGLAPTGVAKRLGLPGSTVRWWVKRYGLSPQVVDA